jgi:hypothetical protein
MGVSKSGVGGICGAAANMPTVAACPNVLLLATPGRLRDFRVCRINEVFHLNDAPCTESLVRKSKALAIKSYSKGKKQW